jgi:hypothetical protein
VCREECQSFDRDVVMYNFVLLAVHEEVISE